MAGSKDKCDGCSQPFYGKQKYLRCKECGKRWHKKCVMLPDSEVGRMMTGVSPFICNDCITVERTHSPSSDEARPDDEQDSPCPDRLGEVAATSVAVLRDLLADALNGISFLTDQMTAVREENARLRSELTRSSEIHSVMLRNIQTELRDLRHRPRYVGVPPPSAAVAGRHDLNASVLGGGGAAPFPKGKSTSTVSEEPVSFSEACAVTPRSPPEHQRDQSRLTLSGRAFRETTTELLTGIPSVAASATRAEGAGGSAAHSNRDEGGDRGETGPLARGRSAAQPGLPEYSARKVPGLRSPGSIPQRPFFKGSSKNGGITAVSVSVRHSRAVFVTRLDANCSSADVREHLGQFLGPKELRCTKLKTRYGGYSSFHVAAVDDDIEALFDPNIWPEGCLFREFQGRLTGSRVHDENERIE